jgi:WD40 repeat protein
MEENLEDRILNNTFSNRELNTSLLSDNFSVFDFQENIIFRCLKCPFIPLIQLKTDSKNSYIFSLCRKFHSYKKELSEYLKENDKAQLYKAQCCKCNEFFNKKKVPYYYCEKCNKFYCEICKEKDKLTNHVQITLHKFDSICPEHEDKFVTYCEVCQKNLCIYCLNEHKQNHKFTSLSSILLRNKDIQRFNKQFQKANIHIQKIQNISENIIKDLKKKVDDIQKAFNSFKEKNEIQLNFAKGLLDTLELKNKNRELNFEIIDNIKSNFNFNYKEIGVNEYDDIFVKANKILSYLKNANNLILGNKDNFLKMKNLKTLNNDKDEINKIILLENNLMASCSNNSLIRVYETNNYELKLTIKEHNNSVKYISKISNDENINILISASSDCTIKIIKLKSDNEYEIMQILTGHECQINKVIELSNLNLISCSIDGKIKIWNKSEESKIFNCIHTFEFMTSEVNSVFELPNKEIILSCSNEKILGFINIKQNEDEEIINYNFLGDINCSNKPDIFHILKENILAVCAEKGIYLIDYESHQITKFIVLDNHDNHWFDCIIKLRDNSYLLSNCDRNKYSFKNYNIMQFEVNIPTIWDFIGEKNYTHLSLINTICQNEDGTIISGAKEIKIWK